MNSIKFKKFHENAIIPTRATDGSVGYDLYTPESVEIGVNEMKCINLYIGVQPPSGYFALIKPRSGLAFRNQLDILAGVIDIDFVHPLKILLINHGKNIYKLNVSDRIAQLILIKYITPEIEVVEEFVETDRCKNVDYGGFGSTGK